MRLNRNPVLLSLIASNVFLLLLAISCALAIHVTLSAKEQSASYSNYDDPLGNCVSLESLPPRDHHHHHQITRS